MPKMYQRQVEFYKPFENGTQRRSVKPGFLYDKMPNSPHKKPKMIIFGVIIVILSGLLFWDLSGESDASSVKLKVSLTAGALFKNALVECRVEAKQAMFVELELGILRGNLNLDELVGGDYRIKNVQFKGITKSNFYLSKDSELSIKKVIELIDELDPKSQFVFARLSTYNNFWDWLNGNHAQYFVYAKGVNK